MQPSANRSIAWNGLAAIIIIAGADATSAQVTAPASVSYPPVERQIAWAVSPLPEPLRKGARVVGYASPGKLSVIRKGTNDMVCLADDPTAERFHVSCYHKSLEPFMARGRELQGMKKSREAVDSIRLADIRRGRYAMPSKPATLYQYFAARDSVDAGTGAVNGASYLYVVYIPYATEKTTGLTANPLSGGPWIMYPGKPWSHIMIAPQKPARVTP
ncbi:MAG TPA: hypothetical protein VM939_14165 [Gemmatimonadaceae bacterium]|nr:hypothetical protein [Gemmatimonadaceae bacterium]